MLPTQVKQIRQVWRRIVVQILRRFRSRAGIDDPSVGFAGNPFYTFKGLSRLKLPGHCRQHHFSLSAYKYVNVSKGLQRL